MVGGNGTTLVAVVGQAGTAWTHYSVDLAAGDWRVGSITGAVATKAQIKAVLADVDQLLIRAEYHSGDEQGGLDNVFLKSPSKHGGGVFDDGGQLAADEGGHHLSGAHLDVHGLAHQAIV